MFAEMIQNEEAFVKRVVTERYMSKYDQFKKRIAKYQDKQQMKSITEQEISEKVIEPIP